MVNCDALGIIFILRLIRTGKCLDCAPLQLAKRGQSFTINEIKKPLRRAAWIFLPCSHCCTVVLPRPRMVANTAWLTWLAVRIRRMSSGWNGRCGGKQSASILRRVISSMAPTLKRSRAISFAMFKISLIMLYLPYRAARQQFIYLSIVCRQERLRSQT